MVVRVALSSFTCFCRSFSSSPRGVLIHSSSLPSEIRSFGMRSLATYGLAAENVLAVIAETCQGGAGAEQDLGEVLSAVLDFLAAEPALACVLTEGALNDVRGLPAARAEFTARCSASLASIRGEEGSGRSDRRAKHLVGGMQGWLSMRLAAGKFIQHPDDLAQLLII